MSENVLHSTTQKFLDIFDITNNVVLLKDGTCSLIIQVDAMNFGLLAEEEQDSIMYAYAGLLNSLNYPIQIIIHSQTKDVTGYLQILKEQEDAAEARTKQQRIRRYREFVSNLIRERNVLDKKFYVSISATPLEVGLLAAQSFIPGQSETAISPEQRTAVLEKARNLLEPKRDHLLAQFARIGLFARQLSTQEIIQFFYVSYNPEAAEGQQIADTSNYTTPLVTAGMERIAMNDAQSPAQNQPQQPADQTQTQPEQLPVAEVAQPSQAMPSPVPQPVAVPPALTNTTPPTTPQVAITKPGQDVPQTETAPSPATEKNAGYTPTQMPVQQTPQTLSTPEVQPPFEASTGVSNISTPQPASIPGEPAADIVKPESTEATTQATSGNTTPETNTPAVDTNPTTTAITPPAPETASLSESKTPTPPTAERKTSSGPTLESTTGNTDLPKPTLPPTPNTTATEEITEAPPTDATTAVPQSPSPNSDKTRTATETPTTASSPVSEPKSDAEEPKLSTSSVQQSSESPKEANQAGTNLPPLHEI